VLQNGLIFLILAGDGTFVTLPVVPVFGNIATINLDGNASNALRGDGSFGPVDSAGTSISNGLTDVSIPSANGNVLININDGSAEWEFQENGTLILPGDLALPGGLATITTTNAGGDTEISTPGNIKLHNSTSDWIFDDTAGQQFS